MEFVRHGEFQLHVVEPVLYFRWMHAWNLETYQEAGQAYEALKAQYRPRSLVQITDMREWELSVPEGLAFDVQATRTEIPIRAAVLVTASQLIQDIIHREVVRPANQAHPTFYTRGVQEALNVLVEQGFLAARDLPRLARGLRDFGVQV